MAQEVFSICFMCTVRCPIRVEVENDEVTWIEGNPHVPGIEGALCAKGSAGLALLNDTERPQHPMIRTGPRGAGQWRRATWEEALDYVADKLKGIIRSISGTAVQINAASEQILAAWQELARSEGLFCEPSSAAGLAALQLEPEPPGSTVVCIVTGHGLKDPETASRHSPPTLSVDPDPDAIAAAGR